MKWLFLYSLYIPLRRPLVYLILLLITMLFPFSTAATPFVQRYSQPRASPATPLGLQKYQPSSFLPTQLLIIKSTTSKLMISKTRTKTILMTKGIGLSSLCKLTRLYRFSVLCTLDQRRELQRVGREVPLHLAFHFAPVYIVFLCAPLATSTFQFIGWKTRVEKDYIYLSCWK